jgi:hypothetical protein
MQVVIRQADVGSKTDVNVIATYEDSVSVEAAGHGQGAIIVKNVPPAMVSLEQGAGITTMKLNAQWLVQNRP